MPSYLHPGVYIEEIPSGVKPIEGVSTSTAAFVGYTTKGPVGEPVLIFKFDDYVRRYGGIRDQGSSLGDPMGFSVAAFFQNGGTKAYIVRLAQGTAAHPLEKAEGYIQSPADPAQVVEFAAVDEGTWGNGLIVKVTPKPAEPAELPLYKVEIGRNDYRGEFVPLEVFADVSFDDTSPRFIEAVVNGVSENVNAALKPASSITPPTGGTSTSGDLSGADLDLSSLTDAAARKLKLTLDSMLPALEIELPAEDFSGRLEELAAAIQVAVRSNAQAERRTNFTAGVQDNTLVLTSGTRGSASSVVVDGSVGIASRLRLGTDGGTEAPGEDGDENGGENGGEVELRGGADGEEAPNQAYTDVFTAFEKIRDISILCLPGKAWEDEDGKPVVQAAVSHAEKTKNRMVLVDPPEAAELIEEKDVTDLGLPTSTYSVLYYPWLKVANPFYDAEDNPGALATVLVSPSGYAAGMWSKIDGRRGVWKAPAGVETALLGLAGTQYTVEDAEQDQLNPLGVNALRTLPGFGTVIWGSRTLSTKSNPEWRYVPVRRTAIFIEQSIYNGIQWAVFEPNDHRLWSSLRVNIESFMDGLHRSGAFQGEKASDAYFVRCGLGDTMTQDDIDRGQVIVIVGFAPLKPAEFVIVRIQQKVAQQ